jgi:sugar phosphate isomerase/epimerase
MEVAVRDFCLYQAGYRTAIEGAKDLGLSAIEVAIDKDGGARSLATDRTHDLSDPADLASYKAELEQHGVRVCALLCANDFNAEDRRPHLGWVIQAVSAAEGLGTPAVRVDSIMTGQTDLPLEERVRIHADACLEVLRATADSEVALGIENHGPHGNDPGWMRAVVRRVGSPRLGLTLDLGNWYWYGHPLSALYGIYEEFAPLVKATHVKNIGYPEEIRETQRVIGFEYGKYCCPLEDGDIDMRRAIAILRRAGYDGPLTIEDESLGKFSENERKAVLRRDVGYLKSLPR